MSDYLSIVRTVYSGLSRREVAKTHQVSRNTVALLLRQAKSHVTLHLLWEEYVESSRQDGSRCYMETQFRHYYHKFARVHKATIRLEHKPALSLEVDWAGTKIAYFDADLDEMAQ